MQRINLPGKQVIMALMLTYIILHPSAVHADSAVDTLEKKNEQICEKMNTEEQDDWETIADFLEREKPDMDGLRDHVNEEVIPSEEQLQAEVNLQPFTKCPDMVEAYSLYETMNMYMDLLKVIDHRLEEEESLEIEDITIWGKGINSLLMETVFQDGRNVTTEYLFHTNVHRDGSLFLHEWEKKIKKAQPAPGWLSIVQEEIMEPLGQVISNPLTKGANLYADHKEENKEQAKSEALKEFGNMAYLLEGEVMLTVAEEGLFEEPYYRTSIHETYYMYSLLRRWETVHERIGDFPFDAEKIADRDWQGMYNMFPFDYDVEGDSVDKGKSALLQFLRQGASKASLASFPECQGEYCQLAKELIAEEKERLQEMYEND